MFKVFRFSMVAIALIIAFQFSSAIAVPTQEKWVYVHVSQSPLGYSIRFYVDTNSLKRNKGIVWYWVKVIGIQARDSEIYRTDGYNSVDCRTGKTRAIRMRFYDSNQSLLESRDLEGGGIAGTVALSNPVIRFVCRL